jgi:hypothetical protein
MDAGRNVKEQVLKEIPNAKIDVMQLDLSSMGSVRKFASDYNESGSTESPHVSIVRISSCKQIKKLNLSLSPLHEMVQGLACNHVSACCMNAYMHI